MSASPLAAVPSEPSSLAVPARETLYLVESQDAVERSMLQAWLDERGAGESRALFYDRPGDEPASKGLVEALCRQSELSDDTWLAPLRVVWLPPKRHNERKMSMRDLIRLSNPRQPSEQKKRRLRTTRPDRWRIVEAEPARLGDLRARWQSQDPGETSADMRPFARFVARQAQLSLERAEYRMHGARYKIPRVTKDDVAALSSYRRGIAALAAQLGRDEASVRKEAETYLDELRTGHDPYTLDLAAKAFHWMYASAYGEVDVDPAEIERLR
ncbi:MAG: hypothetical protein ABW194_10060, partial [Novosphingobium sp.]